MKMFTSEVDEERPLNIWVYPNGDENSVGHQICIHRRKQRNWVTFLEQLTSLLHVPTGNVHFVYDMDGNECRHFRDLEFDGEYVAGGSAFIRVQYGKGRKAEFNQETKYTGSPEPGPLDSRNAALEMYKEKNHFKPMLDDLWNDEDEDFDLR